MYDIKSSLIRYFGTDLSYQFKTNNIIIDSLIYLFLCSLLNYCIPLILNFKLNNLNQLLKFKDYKKNSILLESLYCRWDGVILSKELYGVLLYVNTPEKIKKFNKLKNIKQLTSSYSSIDSTIYFPVTKNSVLLEDDLYMDFVINELNCPSFEDSKYYTYEIYKIHIWSKTKSISHINSFIQLCIRSIRKN